MGLVDHALRKAQVELSPAIAQQLAVAAQTDAQRCLMLAAETLRLQRCLDAAQIPVLVLKGAVLAQLAYGSLTLKHSKDIDLLVPRDRVEDALHLLERDGYELVQPARRLDAAQWRAVFQFGTEITVFHRAKRVQIELRWRVVENPSLFTAADIFARTLNVPLLSGASLRTFAEESQFAYLCVHGANHGWARLKWLADFNAFIASKSKDDLERLYHHADALGCGLCVGLALLLCSRLLALRLPERLAGGLRGSRRLKILQAMALYLMTGPDVGSTRVTLMQFLTGQGWRYFFAQCRIVSVRVGDVVSYPLPSSLHFLYPLLRFPLWLWRRSRRSGANPVARKNVP